MAAIPHASVWSKLLLPLTSHAKSNKTPLFFSVSLQLQCFSLCNFLPFVDHRPPRPSSQLLFLLVGKNCRRYCRKSSQYMHVLRSCNDILHTRMHAVHTVLALHTPHPHVHIQATLTSFWSRHSRLMRVIFRQVISGLMICIAANVQRCTVRRLTVLEDEEVQRTLVKSRSLLHL